MQISSDDLPLPTAATAVGGGHSTGAGLTVPGYQTILSGTGHGQGPDGVGVPITVTVVMISTSITTGPHKDATLALSTISYSIDESSAGKVTWSINSLTIIIRTPRCTKN